MRNIVVVKVGASKRVPQSRIWVEGRRLIGAGFVHGARYDVVWNVLGATLTLSSAGARKVAGTIDRPIIDITGEKVRALCATLCTDRVIIIYSAQKIEIERGE